MIPEEKKLEESKQSTAPKAYLEITKLEQLELLENGTFIFVSKADSKERWLVKQGSPRNFLIKDSGGEVLASAMLKTSPLYAYLE